MSDIFTSKSKIEILRVEEIYPVSTDIYIEISSRVDDHDRMDFKLTLTEANEMANAILKWCDEVEG